MSPARRSTGAGEVERAALLFAALGDATRLQVVARLGAHGPASIARLSAGAAVSRQAITKHLHVLAAAGLVRDRRRGREHLWTLDLGQFAEAQRFLDRLSRQWDEALERLRQLVEDT